MEKIVLFFSFGLPFFNIFLASLGSEGMGKFAKMLRKRFSFPEVLQIWRMQIIDSFLYAKSATLCPWHFWAVSEYFAISEAQISTAKGFISVTGTTRYDGDVYR